MLLEREEVGNEPLEDDGKLGFEGGAICVIS